RAPHPAIPVHVGRRCRGAQILVRASTAADEGPVPLGFAHRQGHGAGAGVARRPRQYRADGVGGAALRLDQRAQTLRALCRHRAQRSRRGGRGGGETVHRRAMTDATTRRRARGPQAICACLWAGPPESHCRRRSFRSRLGRMWPAGHTSRNSRFNLGYTMRVPVRATQCRHRIARAVPNPCLVGGDTKLAEFVSIYGIWLVAAFIALESVGIPLPAEAALIAAGFFAARTHHLDIWSLIAAGIAAAILGEV